MTGAKNICNFLVASCWLASEACSPPPTIREGLALVAITPDKAVVGVPVAVEITGKSFVVPIQVNLGNDRLELAPVAVNLGGKSLSEVVLASSNLITAKIPGDQGVGHHDLEVAIAGHGSAWLTDAFAVLAPITAQLAAPQDLAVGEVATFSLTVSSRSPAAVKIELGGTVSSDPPGVLATGGIPLEPDLAPGQANAAIAWVREVGGDLMAQEVTLTVPVRWTHGGITGTVNATARIGVLAQKACTTTAQCQDPCRSIAACTAGRCELGPVDRDSDHDGAIDIACGGDDCDDQNGSAFPGQTWFADCDGDGAFKAASILSCAVPASACDDGMAPDGGWRHTAGEDCDDEDGSVTAGQSWYADCDQDGAFQTLAVVHCGPPTTACADGQSPEGGWENSPGSDCDDEDPDLFPGQNWYADCDGDGAKRDTATVACNNPATVCADAQAPDGGWTHSAGADCDDEAADLFPNQTWYADCDADGVFASAAVVGCSEPASDCDDGQSPDGGWSFVQGADCDDEDNGVTAGQTWYADCDDDGAHKTTALIECDMAPATDCTDGQSPDGGWSNSAGSDCDDEDPDLFPDQTWHPDCDGDGAFLPTATTSCQEPTSPCADGLAPNGGWSYSAGNDCDDEDEGAFPGQNWFADCDGDGHRRASSLVSCAAPASPCSDGLTPDGGYGHLAGADCDDEDGQLYPGRLWFADCDGDGEKGSAGTTSCSAPTGVCADGLAPDGGWSDTGGSDCDDENPAVTTGESWYADCDGDTYFRATFVSSCAAPATACLDGETPDGGWSNADPGDSADCDDENPTLLAGQVWYADTDGDTYGDPDASQVGCDQPGGYVANAGDCDDAGPCAGACSPDQIEASAEANCADGADNDCDGATDLADVDCGSDNTPPVPVLAVMPPAGDPTSEFYADASGTWDREDSDPTHLTFDWDWENDGTFDHLDDPTPAAPFGYTSAGTYTVVLRVTDTGGLQSFGQFVVVVISDAGEQITVTNGNGSGPGSFAAAIDDSNSRPGRQAVYIPPGTEVTLTGQIVLTDPVDIVADGATLTSDGTLGDCLVPLTGSDGSGLYGFEIKGCSGAGFRAQQTGGHTISRCYFHDNQTGLSLQSANNTVGPNNLIANHAESGIELKAANLAVRGNLIRDNQGAGIKIFDAGSGAVVERNVLLGNTQGCDLGSKADGVLIRHNTFFANDQGIAIKANVDATDCRNNILSHHTSWGLSGNNGNFTAGQFDYNAFFANGAGSDHCSGCSDLGGHSSLDQDPLFVNTGNQDLRLLPASPLIDIGLDVGVDMNGPLPVPPYPPPELYNGAGPEIGAWEAP